MDNAPGLHRIWPRAIVAGLATGALCTLVAGAGMVAGLRADADRTAAALERETARIAATTATVPERTAAAELARAGVAARITGPRGAVRVDGNLTPLWEAGRAPLAARIALIGSPATVGHGVVEAQRPLGDGRTLTTRAPLSMGAAGVFAFGPGILGLIVLLSLGGGCTWALVARRRQAAVSARAVAIEAAAAGRAAPVGPGGGSWRQLDRAVSDAGQRVRELRDAAEVRMEALGAAVAPLALPAAARTPSGGVIRNEALEALGRGLPVSDRDRIDVAIAAGLAGRGATAGRVELDDGRLLAMESWAVPGGRIVTLVDRSEQERLAALRSTLVGGAARQLRAPLAEIARNSDHLVERAPVAVADQVRAIRSAADRLERLVARMLRVGAGSEPAPPPRAVGLATLAHGLSVAYDRPLRERGLRLEHELPSGSVAALADPGLLHEVLAELIDNAAQASPRGGVITLQARREDAATVSLTVRDNGEGIPSRDRQRVLEPFGRGVDGPGRPGAGLGLGVARALVERMGGRLDLPEGPGGQARVFVPAAAEETAEAAPAASLTGATTP